MDKVFNTKRKYIASDGEEYINMSVPVVDIKKINSGFLDRLNQDDNGRLDRFVWNRVAKNLDMIDIVMYANHIFNPFSVKEGDVLYGPIDNDDVYYSSSEPKLPDGSKHSKNANGEKEKTYAQMVEYMAKQGLGIK